MTDEKPPTIARRDFLTRIGRVAGGSAMVRTMAALGIGTSLQGCGGSSSASAPPATPAPPPAPPPPQAIVSPRPGDWPASVGAGKSVAILGAGIAGMTAALEMSRLGYNCTVLEARSTAGGRVRTLRAGDAAEETDSSQVCLFDPDPNLYFNAGPSRIAHHHEFLLGYCRAFGVALETFTNDNRAALLHRATQFGGQPQVARRVLSDRRGYIADLLSSAIDQGALDAQLTAADRQNVLRMLAQFGDLDAAGIYRGSARSGFPGQEDTGSRQRGSQLAPLSFTELIAELFWEQRGSFAHGLDQQPTMLQPVEGMDRIASAFQAQVQSDIVFDAVVTAIRRRAGGVRIAFERLGAPVTLDADYCVVTLPATVLSSIPNDFAADHANEIANFRYTSALRLAFQSRRFWEQDHNIYGGISWTDQQITQIWYPNHGFGEYNGIVLGAYVFDGPAGDALTGQSPDQRVATVQNQAARVHPEMLGEAARGISVAWNKVPFQLGGWGTSVPSVLLMPDDRFFFAGEHLSILQGWQEGAILSAYHAIDQVVQRDTV